MTNTSAVDLGGNAYNAHVLQHWLQEHIRCCDTDEGLLFLDLRRNQYFGLGRDDREALHRVLSTNLKRAGVESDARGMGIVRELVDRQVLLRTPRERTTCTQLVDASDAIGLEELDANTGRISSRTVAAFVGACATARLRLRFRSLETIVRNVAEVKASAALATQTENDRRMRELSTVFRRIRPLIYSARDVCLYDSLVLITFLAKHRLFPTWVIGVKTRPFGAHSWVQHGALVLNDSPETVRAFVPILTV